MKLYIIAGEASGDLHGSNLIRALKHQQTDIECRVWGGDLMQAAGGHLVKHYRELAFMGFAEVVRNLPAILRNFRFCKKDILEYRPDALVLIDYPGFNLRMAKWAKKQGIRVFYYISPQLWAWHTSRVHTIKRCVDKMIVILPFEVDFYRKFGMNVEYVGHPLLDVIPIGQETSMPENSGKKIIALLPGSRKQEVRRILPPMLSVVAMFSEYEFVIAGATALPNEFYHPFLTGHPNLRLVRGNTYDLLRSATAALVKSGTSTLETALVGTPQVVCYAGSPLSFAIAKRVVRVPYISLVNLILDRPLVRELIQDDLNTEALKNALGEILKPENAEAIRAGYAELRQKLGAGGASERAAQLVMSDK